MTEARAPQHKGDAPRRRRAHQPEHHARATPDSFPTAAVDRATPVNHDTPDRSYSRHTTGRHPAVGGSVNLGVHFGDPMRKQRESDALDQATRNIQLVLEHLAGHVAGSAHAGADALEATIRMPAAVEGVTGVGEAQAS